ncbi:MAG TPA: ECF-type sigma factor [Blastocatellia bacterium]|nr:ECF-type sigma factor [Blastocatellia bacterium]
MGHWPLGVDLRYFDGESLRETADAPGVSVSTVGQEARLARAWLRREMNP